MGNNIKMVNRVETRVEKRDIENELDFIEYELWLEKMESKGWNFKGINGENEHVFQKGKSKKVRYCRDTKISQSFEYINMFKEFGWNLVYSNSNTYIWAMEYKGERPAAYNDMEKLKELNLKYRKKLLKAFIWKLIYGVILILMYKEIVFKYPLFTLGGAALIVVIFSFRNIIKEIKFVKTFNKNKVIIDKLSCR